MEITDRSEFRALWDKAAKLVDGRVNLDGQALPAPRFFEKHRLRRAMALFVSAASVEPANPAPLLFASKIQERLGNIQASLDFVRKAHALEPDNLILIIELGAALGRCGLHDEAVLVLTNGITLYPAEPRLHCNLGLELLMSGNPQMAVFAFERLVELEPNGQINKRLLALASDVSQGHKSTPRNEKEIVRLM